MFNKVRFQFKMNVVVRYGDNINIVYVVENLSLSLTRWIANKLLVKINIQFQLFNCFLIYQNKNICIESVTYYKVHEHIIFLTTHGYLIFSFKYYSID